MRLEGPGEALMQTTQISEARDRLVEQAVAGMTPADRTRLQAYAQARGLTEEEAVVQIVTQQMAGAR